MWSTRVTENTRSTSGCLSMLAATRSSALSTGAVYTSSPWNRPMRISSLGNSARSSRSSTVAGASAGKYSSGALLRFSLNRSAAPTTWMSTMIATAVFLRRMRGCVTRRKRALCVTLNSRVRSRSIK
ncbi:hypothetical protein D9M69_683010 [compost metagenome]